MLVNLIVVIISLCTCILKHQIVHLQYIQLLPTVPEYIFKKQKHTADLRLSEQADNLIYSIASAKGIRATLLSYSCFVLYLSACL